MSRFDVVCVVHDEAKNMYIAVHFQDRDVNCKRWVHTGNVGSTETHSENREYVFLYGEFSLEEMTYSVEAALDQAVKMSRHLGIRPENVIKDTVFPCTTLCNSITWKVPNWRSRGCPFTKVFPGRPVPKNVWDHLLQGD